MEPTALSNLKLPRHFPQRKIVTRAIIDFLDNDLATSAAAISYFSMLMLFPLMVVLISVGQFFFGTQQVEKILINSVLALLPGMTRGFVQQNFSSINVLSPGIFISCLLIVVWAASWILTVIEKALNRVWKLTCRSFLNGRLLTVGMMIILGFALMATAIATSFVTMVRAKASELTIDRLPMLSQLGSVAWLVTVVVASLVLTIAIFTLIYKFMPNAYVNILDALPGACVAGVLWETAKYLFAWVLPYFHYDLLYGPIGAAVALLSWVYISSIIMLFGAQLTALLQETFAPVQEHEPSSAGAPAATTASSR